MNYEFRVSGTDRWKVTGLNGIVAGEIYFWKPTQNFLFLPAKGVTFTAEQLISVQTFLEKLEYERAAATKTLTNTTNCDSLLPN